MSKVSAAQAREAKTPIATEEPSIFRRSMERSERQLEQLVEELRQMSKTPALALPPIIMASSSSGSSQDGELEASKQLSLVPIPPNVSRHQQQTNSGREGGGESGEQLEGCNLSTEASLVTQTTPHPQPRGIMPTAQPDLDDATHRHGDAGQPAKSKSETAWDTIGGGLVKEYRRENTREYSRLKESTKGFHQNDQIPPGPHLPPLQPNELRSHPEGQMQVDTGLSHVDSGVIQVNCGVSQIARDSYDQLLATELEIQRLR